jgi:hypothetical protein
LTNRKRIYLSLALLFESSALWSFTMTAEAAGMWANRPAENRPVYSVQVGIDDVTIRSRDVITNFVFLPVISDGISYGTVAVLTPASPTDPPAANHPDKNLALRGYITTTAYLGLVDLPGGSADPLAPQLAGLFADNRVPILGHVYKVYDWDWSCNCRGAPINDYEVTLAGMGTKPGEIIQVPGSGYDIGRMPSGYSVMVLYASSNRITLKYTRDDDVIHGYTIHLENVGVDPSLLALYDSMNTAGRVRLPALYAGQGLGHALGSEIQVAIRDTGAFLDPRSHLDWWQGR